MAKKGKLDAPGLMLIPNRYLPVWAWRLASLSPRGLLLTMAFEGWVNGRLPADPATLAKVLGLPEEEVRQGLPQIADFLTFDGQFVEVSDVRTYRERLEGIAAAQSQGGIVGAQKTNAIKAEKKRSRQRHTANPSGDPSPHSSGNSSPQPSEIARVPVESSIQHSTAQQNKTPSVVPTNSFVEEMERFERLETTANAYRKAKGG